MFCSKKTEKRIVDLEMFEKGVCTIVDGYFKTNTQTEVRYSMDNAVDKFWHFVKSVDDRLKALEKELGETKFTLEGEILECEAVKKALVETVEENEKLNAIINAQQKEIETLVRAKKNNQKGGKNNGVQE